MTPARRTPPRTEVLPGTLDMLILQTLRRGDLHGYGIAQRIRQRSDDVLQIEEGSLYPALQRLQVKGWVHRRAGARCPSDWRWARRAARSLA